MTTPESTGQRIGKFFAFVGSIIALTLSIVVWATIAQLSRDAQGVLLGLGAGLFVLLLLFAAGLLLLWMVLRWQEARARMITGGRAGQPPVVVVTGGGQQWPLPAQYPLGLAAPPLLQPQIPQRTYETIGEPRA